MAMNEDQLSMTSHKGRKEVRKRGPFFSSFWIDRLAKWSQGCQIGLLYQGYCVDIWSPCCQVFTGLPDQAINRLSGYSKDNWLTWTKYVVKWAQGCQSRLHFIPASVYSEDT